MTDKVVSLNGDVLLTENNAVSTVVECCERLLERAKAGEIDSIAYAVSYSNNANGVGSGWERADFVGLKLAAAILFLYSRFSSQFAQDDNEG